MKCYKIKNVDKAVCTVEQKLAYNIAFRCHISYTDKYKACETEIQRNELVTSLRDLYMGYMKEKKVKYNPDALFVALNQGLKNYIEHPFIATDYEQIGKAFPIPYNVE